MSEELEEFEETPTLSETLGEFILHFNILDYMLTEVLSKLLNGEKKLAQLLYHSVPTEKREKLFRYYILQRSPHDKGLKELCASFEGHFIGLVTLRNQLVHSYVAADGQGGIIIENPILLKKSKEQSLEIDGRSFSHFEAIEKVQKTMELLEQVAKEFREIRLRAKL